MSLQTAVDKKAQLQKDYQDQVKPLIQQTRELQQLVAETAERCKQSRSTLAEAKTRWDLVAAAFPEDAEDIAADVPGEEDSLEESKGKDLLSVLVGIAKQ